MKHHKKLLVFCLILAVTMTVSVLGTVAYLTDRDSTVGTFTIGQVYIKLDETAVDENGSPIEGAARVRENVYHLLPGMTYTKDPTVTVQPNSEAAYIRMILTVHNAAALRAIIDAADLGDFSGLISGWDPEIWLYLGFSANETENTISYEFRYKETVSAAAEAVVLPALFTQLVVPTTVTGAELETLYNGGFKMVVNGHAIQAAGFADADAAWAAFDRQKGS